MPIDFLSDQMNPPQNDNVKTLPRDFLLEDIQKETVPTNQPKESYGMSAALAIPRVASDVATRAYNAITALPENIEKLANTKVPYMYTPEQQDKLRMQGIAGLHEGINTLAQAPLKLSQYLGSQRLHLLPQGVEKFIGKITPEDTTNAINELFPQARSPQEKISRGLNRNLVNIFSGIKFLQGANNLRPSVFAKNKVNQIRQEYANALKNQQEAYKPSKKYDAFPVTLNPKDYLTKIGIDKNRLYPEAKLIYDEFIKDPNFKNLHDLQSKIGDDWSKINLKYPKRAQLFNQYRNKLKSNIQNFLKRDQEALEGYNLGSDITANLLKPYEANEQLKKIIFGTKNKVSSNELKNAILKGTEKIKSKKGMEVNTKIPKGHPLHNHLRDIERHKFKVNKLALGVSGAGLYEFGHAFGPEIAHKIRDYLMNNE